MLRSVRLAGVGMPRASFLFAMLSMGIAASAAVPAAENLQALADREQFHRFIQRSFIAPLGKQKVAGAVLVAVKDAQELYRIAYGYGDMERRAAVDVDHSMFGIASISKTFTATAIAQLKGQGLLDYDDAVERRLCAFELRGDGGRLRIANLLTHTTGIPDLFLGAACRSGRDCLPLMRFLAERQPAARAPPGTFVSYSNFSNALAGQIVADVSGGSYGDYLRDRILRPLGMRNTRYDVPGEPQADDRDAVPALSYEIDAQDRLVRSPPYYSMFYPAGQIAASGADMARYMIAHLEGGPFLADAERLDMQKLHARTPGFNDGYGWGWNSRRAGNTRVIGHGGDLRGVVSDLLMVPDARFGYFVAITGDAGPVLEDLSQAFKETYLSAAAPHRAITAGSPEAIAPDIAGVYQDFRFTNGDALQMLSILSETTVRRTEEGIAVDLPKLVGGGTYRLVLSGRDEFRVVSAPEGRRVGADVKLRFLRNEAGAVRYFAFEDRGYDLAAEKIPWWRQTRYKLPAIGLLLLACVCAAALSATQLIRRMRGKTSRSMDGLALAAVLGGALAALAFPIWVGSTFASASRWDLLYGLASLGLRPAYALLPLSAFLLGAGVLLWRFSRSWGAGLRASYAAALISGAACLALLAANGQFAHVY